LQPVNVPASKKRQLNPSLFWEDFEVGHVRETHGLGQGYTFTASEITEFASRFDPQYFHLDPEAAKASLFGGLCASGWHTACVTMRLICDGWNLDSASLGSPGLESLKWIRPVMEGDTIRVRLKVLAARPMNSRADVGLVHSDWLVLNQRDEAVMQMNGWAMLRRRSPASA
jgi:acyl dehydratase